MELKRKLCNLLRPRITPRINFYVKSNKKLARKQVVIKIDNCLHKSEETQSCSSTMRFTEENDQPIKIPKEMSGSQMRREVGALKEFTNANLTLDLTDRPHELDFSSKEANSPKTIHVNETLPKISTPYKNITGPHPYMPILKRYSATTPEHKMIHNWSLKNCVTPIKSFKPVKIHTKTEKLKYGTPLASSFGKLLPCQVEKFLYPKQTTLIPKSKPSCPNPNPQSSKSVKCGLGRYKEGPKRHKAATQGTCSQANQPPRSKIRQKLSSLFKDHLPHSIRSHRKLFLKLRRNVDQAKIWDNSGFIRKRSSGRNDADKSPCGRNETYGNLVFQGLRLAKSQEKDVCKVSWRKFDQPGIT